MPAARPELNADLEIAPPSGGVPGRAAGVAEHARSRSMWSSTEVGLVGDWTVP